MIDIKFLRENPDVVKQNIKNKFQDQKLHLVDEVIALDKESRACKMHGDELRSKRKSLSDKIGSLMKEGRKDEAEAIKAEVKAINDELVVNEEKEEKFASEIKERMMKIPNIIDPSVPIGKDDSENVEVQRFGEPKVPDYEIPYHADIIEKLNGMDKESAGRTSGVGFYYLIGDIARLHEAMLACARDYMINAGFTYAIPPFMIRSDVVTGVTIGAAVQAMYLGQVLIGGVATADMAFVSYPSIALAMLAGADANVAVTLAATVGVLGAALFTGYEILASVFYQLGDKYIAENNIKKIKIAYMVLPPITSFILRFGITFTIVMLGSNYAATLLAAIPQIVLHIAGVLGGVLPAVGISILITYTLKDYKFIIFFLIGMICITFALACP